MEIVLASNNQGKIREIRQLINSITLLSLDDIGFTAEIPEPWQTFEQNALEKADTIYKYCHKNVIADDSGICINGLDGRPGVDSAHYSGHRDDEMNLQKVLADMQHIADRSAYYKAVICLVWNGEVHYFEGRCEGMIASEKRGTDGFGYDPIFVPKGYLQTFGELPLPVKNEISHRAKAVRAMAAFIARQIGNGEK